MKICNAPDCLQFVFSHHYCKQHQYMRTDSDIKPTKPRTISNSIHSAKSTIKTKKREPTFQLELFKSIWNERPHVSELSGSKLMFDVQCFHHILTKQAYPKYLLFKPNIILLTRNEHRMIHDYCFEDLIKKDSRWQMIADKHQNLLEMYNYADKEQK